MPLLENDDYLIISWRDKNRYINIRNFNDV